MRVNPLTYNSSTNAEGFVLGQLYTWPTDGQTYQFVRSANGAAADAISAGGVVEWASTTDYLVAGTHPASSSLGRIPAGLGVCNVTRNYYGLILVKGIYQAAQSAVATIAAGNELTSINTLVYAGPVANAYDARWGVALTSDGGIGIFVAKACLRGGWNVATTLGADPSAYNSSTNAESYVLGQHYAYLDRVFIFARNANAAGDAALAAGDVVEWASTTAYTVSSTRAAGSSLGRIPAGVVPVGGAVSKNNYCFLQTFGRHAAIKSGAGTVTVAREQKPYTATGDSTDVTAAADARFSVALTTVSSGTFVGMVNV